MSRNSQDFSFSLKIQVGIFVSEASKNSQYFNKRQQLSINGTPLKSRNEGSCLSTVRYRGVFNLFTKVAY